ncbi:MAG: DUF2585 family protein [Candidatus Altimarinota bacterium]
MTDFKNTSLRTVALMAMCIIVLQALVLYAMGRLPFCECGTISLWSGDINSAENSQQIFDPYTFSHITHGLLFFLFFNLFPIPWWKKLLFAVAAESAWEILENTDLVINRYREGTISLGYYGDSILNSVMDTLAMIAGFLFASKYRWWLTVLAILVLEVFLLWLIRDNLILNIIMLIYPFEYIKSWQQML